MGRGRPAGAAAQAQPGPARLHPRSHLRAPRARSPARAAARRPRALDVGCGGGLLCEPLARLGATVTGIDPAPASIEAAVRHARAAGLAIDYRLAAAEELVAERRGSTWCAPWRWSSTSPTRRAFSRPAPPWSGPGRRPGPGHPQSHLPRLRARHRRRRVRARLAAARHPQLVALRAALRGGARPCAAPACASRISPASSTTRCATASASAAIPRSTTCCSRALEVKVSCPLRSPGRDGCFSRAKSGWHLFRKSGWGSKAEILASKRKEHAMAKNTICLWYDKDAEAAARFYARPFPTARWCRASCTQ